MKPLPFALLVTLVVPLSARAGTTLVDDFESAGSPAPWTFFNGPEFPGATGALTSGAGHTGKGAHLAYDFTSGGHYVAARFRLAQASTSTQAIALWVRAPAGIHVVLRLYDAGGQTFQYPTARPVDASDAAAWYHLVVPVTGSTVHWGGANDGVLHGGITGIDVLAADPPEPKTVGAIDFDDVSLIDSTTWDMDPWSAGVALPGSSADLFARWGVNIHFTSDNQALDAAHSAGLTWVRMDLAWASVEQKVGVYDFSAFDQLVAALEARAMKALLILDYSNPLHSDGPGYSPQSAATVKAFGDYAEAAARHFAGHAVRFEVWNEPNISFWKPTPSSTQYAALAIEALARVHKGNPSALVSTGGLAGFDDPFLRGYLALGGGAGADAIGVHPYRQGGAESVTDDLLLLRTIVASALPANPPVWDTEWGYSSTWYGSGTATVARQRQAMLVARELLTAWVVGFPLLIYYDIRDDGTDPANAEHNFGLLARDYSDKPAMQAVRALSSAARGRSLTAALLAQPSTLYALRLDGTNDAVIALWSSAVQSPSMVTVPAPAVAVDYLGAPLPLQAMGSRLGITITAEGGPVYLTFPKPPVPDLAAPPDLVNGTTDASVAVDATASDLAVAPLDASSFDAAIADTSSPALTLDAAAPDLGVPAATTDLTTAALDGAVLDDDAGAVTDLTTGPIDSAEPPGRPAPACGCALGARRPGSQLGWLLAGLPWLSRRLRRRVQRRRNNRTAAAE